MSEWFASCMKFGDVYEYIPMRKLRENEPLHGGNMETFGRYSPDKEAVEEKVRELNKMT